MGLRDRIERGPMAASFPVARCGRSDAHGGHWIGPQPSGAPFCVGTGPNVIVAQDAPVQSPFTQRAIADDLPAKDLGR